MAFEPKPEKADRLVAQRPSWSIYESECERALAAGAGAHLAVNFVDLDPYGECWPALAAFFGSVRPFPDPLGIAVNDGMRQRLKMGGGWSCDSMHPAVRQFGNSYIYPHYLQVCRWNLSRLAEPRGYAIAEWSGYYCGHAECMTHFAALLTRPKKKPGAVKPRARSSLARKKAA